MALDSMFWSKVRKVDLSRDAVCARSKSAGHDMTTIDANPYRQRRTDADAQDILWVPYLKKVYDPPPTLFVRSMLKSRLGSLPWST